MSIVKMRSWLLIWIKMTYIVHKWNSIDSKYILRLLMHDWIQSWLHIVLLQFSHLCTLCSGISLCAPLFWWTRTVSWGLFRRLYKCWCFKAISRWSLKYTTPPPQRCYHSIRLSGDTWRHFSSLARTGEEVELEIPVQALQDRESFTLAVTPHANELGKKLLKGSWQLSCFHAYSNLGGEIQALWRPCFSVSELDWPLGDRGLLWVDR